MGLLEQAAIAAAQRQASQAAARLAADNADLAALVKRLVGIDVSPTENRLTVEDVTFTAFDGRLYLLSPCEKCGKWIRSRRPVSSLACLHAARQEPFPAHAPCDFRARVRPAAQEEA